MCVCVRTREYLCVHLCMYTCVHVCTGVFVYTCVHMCVSAHVSLLCAHVCLVTSHTHLHKHVCTRTCGCACVRICVHVCMVTSHNIFLPTCMHTCTWLYACVYQCARVHLGACTHGSLCRCVLHTRAHMHVHNARVCVCVHMCQRVPTCSWVHMSVSACAHGRVSVCACLCVCDSLLSRLQAGSWPVPPALCKPHFFFTVSVLVSQKPTQITFLLPSSVLVGLMLEMSFLMD